MRSEESREVSWRSLRTRRIRDGRGKAEMWLPGFGQSECGLLPSCDFMSVDEQHNCFPLALPSLIYTSRL